MAHEEKEHFHEHPLRWFSAPVEHDEDSYFEENADIELSTTQDVANESSNSLLKSLSDYTRLGKRSTRTTKRMRLKKRSESAPSELFYDLFFVANLNSFTANHPISDAKNLASYVAFFVILWGTWYSVSLYDIRLSRDSVLDRVAKAAQFGVMLGFVIVGINFNPYDSDHGGSFYQFAAQPMSFILMASRFVLAIQYGLTSWMARREPRICTPTTLISIVYIITGFVLLGVAFAYDGDHPNESYAYIAWYVVMALEILINVFCSCHWKVLNFKGTYLTERMSLLTLIILGEGIIGLFESVVTAWNQGFSLNSFLATVISGLLILYFLYQIYFDNLPEPLTPFGTLRQQLWSISHLPLHVALILCVEGSRLFVTWKVAIEVTDTIDFFSTDLVNIVLNSDTADLVLTGAQNTTEYFQQTTSNFTDIANYVLDAWPSGANANTTSDIREALHTITNGATEEYLAVYVAVLQVMITLYATILRAYEIDPPETETSTSSDPAEIAKALYEEFMSFFKLYDLVLIYFFVASGCILIILGIMITISRGKHSTSGRGRIRSASSPDLESTAYTPDHLRQSLIQNAAPDSSLYQWTWLRIFRVSVYFIAGIGLALISLTDLSARNLDNPGENFLESYWILPTVAFTLFGVLLLHHLPLEAVKFGKRGKRSYGKKLASDS